MASGIAGDIRKGAKSSMQEIWRLLAEQDVKTGEAELVGAQLAIGAGDRHWLLCYIIDSLLCSRWLVLA